MPKFVLTQYAKSPTNTNDIKVVLFPVLVLLSLLILTGVVFAYFNGNISNLAASKDTLSKEKIALQEKLNLLSVYQKDSFAQSTQDIASAFPSDNPILPMIGSVRQKATENNVTLTTFSGASENAEAGTKSADSVLNVTVNMDISGSLPNVVAFLKSLYDITPVVRVKNLVASKQSDGLITTSISAFWAKFPEKIPAVTTPVVDLSQEEKDILAQLSALSKSSLNELPAQSPSVRTDPFNL